MKCENVKHTFETPLMVNRNTPYFEKDGRPFFWLGDTAWLLFTNISEEEAYIYLKNRAEKGFNVIQAVLVYATEDMKDVNIMPTRRFDVTEETYWEHCERVVRMAEELGLYMALLPSWGVLVRDGFINMQNVGRYADYLTKRFEKYKNIIWLLGGDVKPEHCMDVYHELGRKLKMADSKRLIGFHPFGRCVI